MIWIVEYSRTQRVFHVDALGRIMETNRRTIEQGLDPGFIPIYATVTREDAHSFVKQWRREHPEGGHDGR